MTLDQSACGILAAPGLRRRRQPMEALGLLTTPALHDTIDKMVPKADIGITQKLLLEQGFDRIIAACSLRIATLTYLIFRRTPYTVLSIEDNVLLQTYSILLD